MIALVRSLWRAVFAMALGSVLAAGLGGGLTLLLRPAFPADQPRQQPKARHARGRVEPANAGHLRAISAAQHGAKLRRIYRIAAPPARWDSAEKGWISPIQNQQQCGSCWDFSGTRVCDTAYNVAGIAPASGGWLFSEQYTLDCGRNGGCGGDDNTTVLAWAKATGLPTQADYGPYTAAAGPCKWSSQVLFRIADWAYCNPSGSGGITPAGQIKTAIMAYGGVGCAVAAGNGWDNYSGGVYQGSGNRSIDHDVFLRGWDDSLSTAPGKTVWLMDNSWGTDWGISGTMQIAEGADQIGTDSVCAWVDAPTPPPGPIPPPPTPPPTPPPMSGWSGTITYSKGMIQSVAPAAK